MDGSVEQVDADKRKIAWWVCRLLDKMHDVAVGVECGDAEAVRIGNLLEQDLRSGRSVAKSGLLKRLYEGGEVLLEQVVAEVHHEVIVTQELMRDKHAVRQAERLVLRDVRNAHTKLAAVAHRRHDLGAGVAHDDADFDNARSRHRLNSVEQNRLVGHRDQLLRAGMGDRAQPCAGAASENECFHTSGKCRTLSQLAEVSRQHP